MASEQEVRDAMTAVGRAFDVYDEAIRVAASDAQEVQQAQATAAQSAATRDQAAGDMHGALDRLHAALDSFLPAAAQPPSEEPAPTPAAKTVPPAMRARR